MGKRSIHVCISAVLTIMAIFTSGNQAREADHLSAQAPESDPSSLWGVPKDLAELLIFCRSSVRVGGEQKKPDMFCCHAVKKFDLTFICQLIPPIAEKFVSMEKLVYVAKKCHHPVDPGTKCGSYTVPAEGDGDGKQ